MENTQTLQTKPRHPWLLLAFIMALAFVLRLERPSLTEFKRDEATVARMAQAIAYEGYLPAVGVDASMGIDNFPLTLYLMALPIRLWRDPLAAVLFTMLLNTLAVWGCYTFGKIYFGERVGLITALLFAVSPWSVLYARKIWCQNMPWATLIFFAAIFAVFVKGRRWFLILACVGAAAMIGLHLSGLAAIPILGLAVLLYRDQVSPKTLVVSALAALVAVSPYILHDAQNGWENFSGIFNYAGGAGVFSWDALRYAFMIAGSYGIPGQAGAYHEQFQASVVNLWWMNHLMTGLIVSGLFYALGQAFRGKTQEQRRSFVLLLLWFFVPVVLQLWPSTVTQPHYFIMLYPTQFLFVAILLARGLELLPQREISLGALKFSLATGMLIVGLFIWSSWQISVIYQQRVYMVEHPSTGGYGIPLRYTRSAASSAKALTNGAEIIVIGESARPFMTETPTVFEALLFGTPHRFTDGHTALPVPEGERAVYLVGPLYDDAGGTLAPSLEWLAAWESVSPGPVTRLPDGVTYRTFVREAVNRNDVIAGMQPLAAGIPFANNVVFAAYEAPETITGGWEAEVWLAWWLRGLPPEGVDYHFTVQLLDENGSLRAQDDHVGFPADYWQTGDLVLSRFTVPVPANLEAGSYQLRAGMYSFPDIINVAVVDPQGTPVDDGINLGTIKITDTP